MGIRGTWQQRETGMNGVRKFRQGAVLTAATIGAALAAGTAQAQDKLTFAYNVGATSDYVFRGISQSDSEPAIQGGVDATYGSFYGGVWASSIDFGLDEQAEVDFYGGIKPVVGPVTLDFGFVYYYYPGLDDSFNGNYVELKAGASMSPVDKVTIGGAVYWSPEFTFSNDADGIYTEINAAYAINDELSVSGAVGHQDVDATGYYFDASDGDSTDAYTTWNLGFAYTLSGVTLDLRYFDTDLEDVTVLGPSGKPVSDNRFAVSLKLGF
jgi:uncharacterized protein (TIGR02001 family)